MRKILLAGAAILGTAGGSWAQTATYQSQGSQALPWTNFYGANTNINANGTAQPGGAKLPDPGTVVIHLNGRVWADVDLSYSSLANVSAAAGSSGVRYKSNPIGVGSYLRLYPGFDGVATNGLRYGASAEIRQNIMSANSFTASTSQTGSTGSFASGSGYSSAETLFTRRAFTYLGSDQLGIIRIGQDDGVVGLFDATGVFTVGTWNITGGILDGDVESYQPNAFLLSWAWLSGNGIEYGQQRISYMSPSFYGFDFAVDFSPSTANSFGNGTTSSPYQTGTCIVESANCDNVTGGADASRPYNRVSAGVRYQGSFSGLDAKAFVLYTHSAGEAIAITGVTPGGIPAGSGASPLTANANLLKYDGQSFIQSGVAFGFQGLAVNAAFTDGRFNPVNNGLTPTGGASTVGTLIGVGYSNGPWVTGTNIAFLDWQGAAQYTHISQRHEFALTYLVGYKLAPGINLAAEYTYIQKHQGGFDFYTNGANATTTRAGNDIHAQGLTLATILSW
jgi:outer membrane protein OmpU